MYFWQWSSSKRFRCDLCAPFCTCKTVCRSQSAKIGKGVCARKYLERPNCQATGWTSCVTQWTTGSRLPFWLPRLNNSTGQQFVYLAGYSFQLLHLYDEHFRKFERLAVILYDETVKVIWAVSTSLSQEVNSFARRIEQWTNFHPPRMRYSNMSDAVDDQHTSTVWFFRYLGTQDFAWTKVSESLVSVWMTIPEVSRSCKAWSWSNAPGAPLHLYWIKGALALFVLVSVS